MWQDGLKARNRGDNFFHSYMLPHPRVIFKFCVVFSFFWKNLHGKKENPVSTTEQYSRYISGKLQQDSSFMEQWPNVTLYQLLQIHPTMADDRMFAQHDMWIGKAQRWHLWDWWVHQQMFS